MVPCQHVDEPDRYPGHLPNTSLHHCFCNGDYCGPFQIEPASRAGKYRGHVLHVGDQAMYVNVNVDVNVNLNVHCFVSFRFAHPLPRHLRIKARACSHTHASAPASACVSAVRVRVALLCVQTANVALTRIIVITTTVITATITTTIEWIFGWKASSYFTSA